MALQFPSPNRSSRPDPSPAQNQAAQADSAVVRALLQELVEEWPNLELYRNYYNGDQELVFGTDKFKEFFPNFEGFEDNWSQIVVDAMSEKIRLIGISLDGETDSEDSGGDGGESLTESTEEPISERIWNVFRDNDIDEQQNDLTEGVFVEGRAAVIVWPDEEIGARIDWQPAQLVKVRYSEDDYRRIDLAVKRWVTSSGEVRVNVYDEFEVRKYVETAIRTVPENDRPGVQATVPSSPPSFALYPLISENEPWPLPHNFGEVPVVEFPNKRGSELSDVIPLQNGINYLMLASFIAAEFSAVKQKVFFTHLKAPVGGWDNSPGRVWHLPPLLDPDGKAIHGEMGEFSSSDLSHYRQLVEMILQHLALTSKTPVRMFFKSDRGGRGDAPSGESQLIEDEPLLDKCEDRQIRMGNRWFRVARLVAKAIGIEETIRGEVIWQDPRSKYRSSLLDEALKMSNLGLPLDWIVEHLGFAPEDLASLKVALEQKRVEDEAKEEQARQDQLTMAANRGNSGFGGSSSGSSNE